MKDDKTTISNGTYISLDNYLGELNAMTTFATKDFQRTFKHPETNVLTTLETNTGIYAWHGEHHLAHVVYAKMSSVSVVQLKH